MISKPLQNSDRGPKEYDINYPKQFTKQNNCLTYTINCVTAVHVLHVDRLQSKNSAMPPKDITHIFSGVELYCKKKELPQYARRHTGIYDQATVWTTEESCFESR